jgi:multicomponent Na+:H+ antiporter subunit E
VDTDQASTTLYIHVIGVSGREGVEEFRRGVYETEARIVRAIGSDAEISMLDRQVLAGEEEHP